MRKILPVADAGLVRLGAGMRRTGAASARAVAPSAANPADAGDVSARPVTPKTTPAAAADSGRVRLGAGMRRG